MWLIIVLVFLAVGLFLLVILLGSRRLRVTGDPSRLEEEELQEQQAYLREWTARRRKKNDNRPVKQ